MKKVKKTVKKTASSRRTTATKAKTLKAPAKRPAVKAKKTSKRVRTNSRLLKAFVTAIFLISVVSITAVAAPGMLSSVLNSNNVLGSETDTVTEDQLAMFATLSYEDATHKQINATTNVIEPVAKDASGNPVSFAVCNSTRGGLDLTNEVTASSQVKDCMTNPSKYSANFTDNMFNTADFVGNDYINLPDNANVADKLTNKIANVMAESIQIEKGEHYYFNNLTSVASAKQSFLKNWIAVDFL